MLMLAMEENFSKLEGEIGLGVFGTNSNGREEGGKEGGDWDLLYSFSTKFSLTIHL
jgi:hypothetical protein